MSKKYFLYTRISKDSYDDSLNNQKDVLLKIAKDRKISEDVLEFYEETESSKTSGSRKKFTAMIKKLQKDAKLKSSKRVYGGILFFKIDRLARNDKDFNILLELLDAGYAFISATETIENTPTGRLLFRMLASFAVFESEKLSSRQIIARLHNLVQKKYPSLGSSTPGFGYKKTEKIKDTQKKILIDVEAAKVIKLTYDIFCLMHQSDEYGPFSYKSLYNEVNKISKGLLYKLYRKESKTTKEKFLSRIITNETKIKYNGFVEYNISVNDESIQKYISTFMDNKDGVFHEISGDVKIGSKIKFILFEPDLLIVDNPTYKQVEDIVANEKKKNAYKSSAKEVRLFSTNLSFLVNHERYAVVSSYLAKEKYVYYRRTVDSKSYEISEKKIEARILASKEFHNLLGNIKRHRKPLANTLVQSYLNSVNVKKEKNNLRASLNLYESRKEDLLIQFLDDKDDKHLALRGRYDKHIQDTYTKLASFDKNESEYTAKLLSLFDNTPFAQKSYYARALLYPFLFDHITCTPSSDSKDYKIALEPSFFLLDGGLVSGMITI